MNHNVSIYIYFESGFDSQLLFAHGNTFALCIYAIGIGDSQVIYSFDLPKKIEKKKIIRKINWHFAIFLIENMENIELNRFYQLLKNK